MAARSEFEQQLQAEKAAEQLADKVADRLADEAADTRHLEAQESQLREA
jgi:hypothetical protein